MVDADVAFVQAASVKLQGFVHAEFVSASALDEAYKRGLGFDQRHFPQVSMDRRMWRP